MPDTDYDASSFEGPTRSRTSQQPEILSVAAPTTIKSHNDKWTCVHSVQGVMGFPSDTKTRYSNVDKSKFVYSELTTDCGQDDYDPIVYYPTTPGQEASFIDVPPGSFKAVSCGPLAFDLSHTTGQRIEVDLAPDKPDNAHVLSGLTRVMVPPKDKALLEDLSLVNVRVYERDVVEFSEMEGPTPTNVD